MPPFLRYITPATLHISRDCAESARAARIHDVPFELLDGAQGFSRVQGLLIAPKRALVALLFPTVNQATKSDYKTACTPDRWLKFGRRYALHKANNFFEDFFAFSQGAMARDWITHMIDRIALIVVMVDLRPAALPWPLATM